MARLITSGAEIGPAASGSPDGDQFLNTPTRDTAVFRSGLASFKFDAGASNLAQKLRWSFTAVASRSYWARGYLRAAAAPSTTMLVFSFQGSAQSPGARLRTDGKLELFANNAVQGSPSASITDSNWHRVEVTGTLNGSLQWTSAELRVDGITVATWSGTSLATSSSETLIVGLFASAGANYAINMDDICVNDSTGSVNNTWPGDGKIVWLPPVSDNAIGTGWTLGTGTAISSNTGAIATDNLPPTGVADLTAGSDGKQIRNASANANTNYDANLQSYSGAGVGASDTINAITPWVCTAAPVATQAKAGTIGISSNPVITNVSLGAGGTAGAFWSGAAGGAYPTGWKWSPGTITEAPSVTKGSSPVIRITQVTSSTRIAVVCSLGMYVDYSPPVPIVKTGGGISARSGGGVSQYPFVKKGGGASPPLSPPPTLDNFNRADENPIAGGWGGAIGGGAATLKVASNLLQAASANGTAYYNTVFAADQSVKIMAVTDTNLTRLYLRLQNPGTSTYDGYMALYNAVAETISIWRIVGGSATSVSSFTGSFPLNCVFEFRVVGNVLTILIDGIVNLNYTDTSGSAILIAGYVGVGADLTSETYDDFGASQTGGGSTHTGGGTSFKSTVSGPTTYIKAGIGISAFSGSGADEFLLNKTGISISARTAQGADSFQPAETGIGISQHVTQGVDSFQPAETGNGISPFSGGGLDSFNPAETGAGISIRAGSGADSFNAAETGAGISPFTAGGVEQYISGTGTTYIKSGIGISDRVGSGSKQAILNKSGIGISPRSGQGADAYIPAETGAGISSFGGQGADAFIAAETGAGISPRTSQGADAFTAAETGNGISPRTAGGVELYISGAGTVYVKSGIGISDRTAQGTDAFQSVETGNGISSRTAQGSDSFNPTETGLGVSVRTGQGADSFNPAETGIGASPRTAFGADAYIDTNTGIGISPRTAGGVELVISGGGTIYIKSGIWISPRSAGGAKQFLAGETGTAVSLRTAGGAKVRENYKSGLGVSDRSTLGAKVLIWTESGLGISTRTSGGSKVRLKAKSGIGIAVFGGSGAGMIEGLFVDNVTEDFLYSTTADTVLYSAIGKETELLSANVE